MCLAVLFFPPHIIQLTNFDTSVLWYMGSGTISRLTICAFLGITKTSRFRISAVEIRNRNSELNWIFQVPQPGLAPDYRANIQLSFRPLRAIFRARLLAVCNSRRVQRSTNDMVANARKVLHTAATDQDDGVFLQIVADTGDVGCHFNPIGQTHTCNFARSEEHTSELQSPYDLVCRLLLEK